MHAVQEMSDAELAERLNLGDDPAGVDLSNREALSFGDETDQPLNGAQARLLAMRHGVYFPWKTCFHFESLHAGLLAELAQLTHAGFERFLADGVF